MAISAALGSASLLPAGLGFRNKLINGDFRINQRGFTSTTSNVGYGYDRWALYTAGGGATYSAQTFTAGNAIVGQEPQNFARIVTTGQTATSTYTVLTQRIEDVRNCAGQTTTVSFWAKASSGTPKVSVEFVQNFGSGGSAEVTTYAGQVTLSTSWQRFTVTANVPSISGKTLGTEASHSLGLFLWVSGGSDLNSRTGSIGIQSNTFDFWGVQLEQNYQPTPFEQRPYGVELALCQRYYYRRTATVTAEMIISGYQPANSNIVFTWFHPQPMRSSPSIAAFGGTWSAVNSAAGPLYSNVGANAMNVYITVNGGIGNANQSSRYSEIGAYIEVGAEL